MRAFGLILFSLQKYRPRKRLFKPMNSLIGTIPILMLLDDFLLGCDPGSIRQQAPTLDESLIALRSGDFEAINTDLCH